MEYWQLEANEIIARFMGHKRTESPVRCDFYCINGLNYKPNKLKYHSSWNWQVPAWSRIGQMMRVTCMDTYNMFCERYCKAIYANSTVEGVKVITEAINWYQENIHTDDKCETRLCNLNGQTCTD